MNYLLAIRAERILNQTQEYFDQILEKSTDPETSCEVSQIQVHIHEALIVLSNNRDF